MRESWSAIGFPSLSLSVPNIVLDTQVKAVVLTCTALESPCAPAPQPCNAGYQSGVGLSISSPPDVPNVQSGLALLV